MQDPGGKASGIATRSVLSSGSLSWGRSLLQLVLLSSLGTPDIGSEVRGLASPVEGQVGSSSVLWKPLLGRPGPGAVGTELLRVNLLAFLELPHQLLFGGTTLVSI